MGLVIRLDIDRPYGRAPLARHFLSRLSSDFYFPKIQALGYLNELRTLLEWMNDAGAHSYIFFRQCTLPSNAVLRLMESGRHTVGLHLENSRSYETFLEEKRRLERHTGKEVTSVSKHGSGGAKYGRRHYAPYEPDRYVEWAQQASMKLFLGNLEDPTMVPEKTSNGLLCFPSAFWLEPYWRDTEKFSVSWLLEHSANRDIVLLVHPENVLSDARLVADFKKIVNSVESRTFA